MMKKIHQLSKTTDLKDFEINSQELLKKHNPTYKYKLWTDDDLEILVKENHPELYKEWDNLKGIHKADLGRYLVLFLEGGFYCDTDFYVSQPFENLKLEEKIYMAPSTPDFLFMKEGVTNYFIYTPPEEQFFLDLIDESLIRIKTYNNNNAGYISSTSGKIMIESVLKTKKYRYDVFDSKQIINKYCSQTPTEKSFGYHDGGTSRDKKTDSWVNGSVLELMKLECNMRDKLYVRGNLCQIPVVFIFFVLLFVSLIVFFGLKYYRIYKLKKRSNLTMS